MNISEALVKIFRLVAVVISLNPNLVLAATKNGEARSIIEWLGGNPSLDEIINLSNPISKQPNRVEHHNTISLDKLLEVMGPGLFPVRMILSLMPFAAPAIPLAAWAESYYEERHKENRQKSQQQQQHNHSLSSSNISRHDSLEGDWRTTDDATKSVPITSNASVLQINAPNSWNESIKCKTITLPNLKVAYDRDSGKCVMAEYRIAGEYQTVNRTNTSKPTAKLKTIQLPALELLQDYNGAWMILGNRKTSETSIDSPGSRNVKQD